MCAVRIAVIDQRRLLREVLCRILDDDARFTVVAPTAEVDMVVGGDVAELARQHKASSMLGLTDETSVDGIGDTLLERMATHDDSAQTTEAPSRRQSVRSSLTQRETEVLQGVAEGLPIDTIAQNLGITRKSIENHKQRIFAKLGVQNQAHAVAVALNLGALTLDLTT